MTWRRWLSLATVSLAAVLSTQPAAALVQRSVTVMQGEEGIELRFLPAAAEFVVPFFESQ